VRVLTLTIELPYAPGGTGGSTRQFELLRRLVELGHEVLVLAPAAGRDEAATGAPEAMRAVGINYRPLRRPPSRALELGRALARQPVLLPRLATRPWMSWQFEAIWAPLRREALQETASLSPDVVLIEHDHLAGWAADLPRDQPVVLSAHNATWRLYEARARSAGLASRATLRAEASRYCHMVADALPGFDGVIAVSRLDADDFSSLGARRVEVVPNGARFDLGDPAPDHADPPTLLFTGSMDHPPNRDAALWLGQEVWPLVAGVVPGARLVIAGRGPQADVKRLAERSDVEVTGPVPDMRPYFDRATAVVVPLRSGGGTRLKVVEALAAGRAVASTRVGAEGLELAPNRDLLIADDAPSLAEASARLLGDRDLRTRLAHDGREAARTRYDWRKLGESLAAALERLASNRR
jgi:polysaccharide biosynthesis protein PslH